jgi:glycosyltransferase involved in cell wall biosynthesis
VLVARDLVDVPVRIVVVADGCLDATADVARGYPGVRVVEIESSNVGTARSVAAETALSLVDASPARVWMANTDADSVVPSNWLDEQLRLADSGIDVMIGTVRPEFDDLTDEQVRAWRAGHVPGEPNGHVHGANLGVRASTYLAAGGYDAMPEHEDVDLVAKLGRVGRVVASDACEVVTSGRAVGRTPGGYARHLREDLVPQMRRST